MKSLQSQRKKPARKEVVVCAPKAGAKGRKQVERVAHVRGHKPSATSAVRNKAGLVLAAAFLFFVGAAAFAGKLPALVPGLYLVASAVAFAAYARDKSAARNNQWRTRERTLQFLSLIGGWPGALAAQKLLRHKSAKPTFQVVFWIIVVLNCGALGWLFSPAGASVLRYIPGVA